MYEYDTFICTHLYLYNFSTLPSSTHYTTTDHILLDIRNKNMASKIFS